MGTAELAQQRCHVMDREQARSGATISHERLRSSSAEVVQLAWRMQALLSLGSSRPPALTLPGPLLSIHADSLPMFSGVSHLDGMKCCPVPEIWAGGEHGLLGFFDICHLGMFPKLPFQELFQGPRLIGP